MASFKALLLTKTDSGQSVDVVDFPEDELMEGDVTVRVDYSTLNYKDGLAITGKAPVVRRWPMIPGVDMAGTVERSDSPEFKPGDQVLVTGWGVGEAHLGAYAEKARVRSDWIVPLPDGLDGAEAMAIGTAGFTSMLCLMALEKHGQTPERGPLVVTGASGGVGSVAVALLAKAGFEVIAVTGKTKEADYLKGLGASEVLDRRELSEKPRPLAKERWAGGVDAVGSTILANVLAMTKYGGAVAACGNAAGLDLPTSVAPFILRGVSLLGVESVYVPKPLRREGWERLARELDRSKVADMTTTIGFDGIVENARAIAEGRIKGRVVVDMAR